MIVSADNNKEGSTHHEKISAQIKNFRSVDDSGKFEIGDRLNEFNEEN